MLIDACEGCGVLSKWLSEVPNERLWILRRPTGKLAVVSSSGATVAAKPGGVKCDHQPVITAIMEAGLKAEAGQLIATNPTRANFLSWTSS